MFLLEFIILMSDFDWILKFEWMCKVDEVLYNNCWVYGGIFLSYIIMYVN